MRGRGIFTLFFLLLCFCFECAYAGQNFENVRALEFEISGEISSPQCQITKRALARANDSGANVVLINLDTPGGDLASTLEIMEAISNSKLHTICFVNPNAISAGCYIAVSCDEIWFAPKGIMGAAEAVSASGEDIGDSMRRKLESFMSAKVKAISQNRDAPNPNIAKVQRAMANPNFELKFGDRVIKRPGELLSLTAQEAVEKFDGFPLLASGIATDSNELLKKAYPHAESIELEKLNLSAFERWSKYISSFSTVIMGIAIFFLFLEIKTAGFGIFGIIFIALMALLFVGVNMAGLAGYEIPIIFGAGVLMLILEFFVLPGTFIFGILGIALISVSLVMLGAAPIPTTGFSDILGAISIGVGKFSIAIIIAFVLLYLLRPLIKTTPLWKRLVLEGGQPDELANFSDSGLVGKKGRVVSDLMPNGKVEVDGQIYDAASIDGNCIVKNTEIIVDKFESFALKVRTLDK